jgi:hypothetical protein
MFVVRDFVVGNCGLDFDDTGDNAESQGMVALSKEVRTGTTIMSLLPLCAWVAN